MGIINDWICALCQNINVIELQWITLHPVKIEGCLWILAQKKLDLCSAVWCNTVVLHTGSLVLSSPTTFKFDPLFHVLPSARTPRPSSSSAPHPPPSVFIPHTAEACEYMNDNSVRVTAEICRHKHHCPRALYRQWQRVWLTDRQLACRNPQQSFTHKHQPPLFAIVIKAADNEWFPCQEAGGTELISDLSDRLSTLSVSVTLKSLRTFCGWYETGAYSLTKWKLWMLKDYSWLGIISAWSCLLVHGL